MKRLQTLDTLRGIAMVWMTTYHFCFDLNHFGWIQQDFYRNPVWTWQRSGIVAMFLFCAGWSQAASSGAGFWRRLAQIAACAALVSISSYIMYPQSWIYFGVLHAIAVMLMLLLLLRRLGQWLWLFGAACMMLWLFPPVAWNAAPANILGLISQKPITEDYVPLLPWLALVCWGYAFGRWFQVRQVLKKKGLNLPSNPLSFLGRYSLSYYMLHQPVLIGSMMLVQWARSLD